MQGRGSHRAQRHAVIDPEKLHRILFWGPALGYGDGVGALAELVVFVVAGKHPDPQPQRCVRPEIPQADRVELAKALAEGEVLMPYMGWADCRMCGERLGTKDLHGFGFMWPEKAEHYILVHNVWTPGCTRLLAAIRST